MLVSVGWLESWVEVRWLTQIFTRSFVSVRAIGPGRLSFRLELPYNIRCVVFFVNGVQLGGVEVDNCDLDLVCVGIVAALLAGIC